MTVRMPSQKSSKKSVKTSPKGRGTAWWMASGIKQNGPIAFFIALIIILVALTQFVSTMGTYMRNASELNSLKAQEASLIARKESLKNDISRWDDDAYVTTQARERLGFVYPGEKSVTLKNSRHRNKTGSESSSSQGQDTTSGQKPPWYKEMFSSLQKADKGKSDQSGESGTSPRISSDKEQQKWEKSRQYQ